MSTQYILVDPFATHTSGVTRYCELAAERLSKADITNRIFSRQSTESIESFCCRVSQTVPTIANSNTIVEVPETLATSRSLPDHLRIHIRIHGSRDMGARIQGHQIDRETLQLELREIGKAWLVSAPSRAAVAAAQLSYRHTRSVRVYPNPLPNQTVTLEDKDCDIDVLFLGRWQLLKGTTHMEQLIPLLPHLRFGIATDRVPGELAEQCVVLKADSDFARTNALLRSRVVAVPSLFETASMVGLEAIAHQRPVVTWSHLGLAEYANAPIIRTVEAFDIESFARSIELALSSPRISSDYIAVRDINLRFDKAIQSITNGIKPTADGDFGNPVIRNTTKVLSTMFNSETTTRHYIFKRKAKKLVRDPAAFWRDSALNKALESSRYGFLPGNAIIRRPGSTKTQVISPSYGRNYPEHRLMGSITAQGFVKLVDLPDRQGEWSTGVIHHANNSRQIAHLIGQLDEFTDFPPLRAESLSIIQHEEIGGETVASIVGRLDQSNKKRVASIRNLICFNSPGILAAALKSCSPSSRVITIITNDSDAEHQPSPEISDTLIAPRDYSVQAPDDWRRIIRFDSQSQLPAYIRRTVQETGPKSPDLLLPLINADEYDTSLLDFDTSRHQGIIELNGPIESGYSTFADLCDAVASRIDRMLIAESTYFRYLTQCQNIERGGSAAILLQLCATDGVLFDVR